MSSGLISAMLRSLESNDHSLAEKKPANGKGDAAAWRVMHEKANIKKVEVDILANEIANVQTERAALLKKSSKSKKIDELGAIIKEGVVDLTKEVQELRRMYAELGKDPSDLTKVEHIVATLVFQEEIDGSGTGIILNKGSTDEEYCELKDLSLL